MDEVGMSIRRDTETENFADSLILTGTARHKKRATYQKYAALVIEIASNLLFTFGDKGDLDLCFITRSI